MSKIDEGIKDSTADIEMGFKDYKDKDRQGLLRLEVWD